ncbi:MAG: ABC transporter permease subunit [Gammaproteobacteria bacterium]|nr:ABC transporter permease subunit [Gammaproteobacteria bacterium]MCY4278759.1 ABC transporter permease subunit [Gammaproteobacteria bacterium]
MAAARRNRDFLWRSLVIRLPYVWLLLFFLAPFLIVFKISFSDPVLAQPPFTPLFDWTQAGWDVLQGTFDNYRFLFSDNLYALSYLKSIWIASVSTVLCLALGYPMAYGIARARPDVRFILLLLVILPFWTSFLLRVYAWMGILSTKGLVNNLLLGLGLIDEPLQILYTDTAVFVGIVYSYLPFMILPLYATLERLDVRLLEVASDLGARPMRVFWDITLPMSRPGVIAGCLLVFIPALGEYVIPALLGGLDSLMIGRQLFDEFYANRDWPVASAVASILLVILVVPMMLLNRHGRAAS